MVHSNYVESPRWDDTQMPQVFPCHSAGFVLLTVIHRGLGGFDVMRGASLDLDETQNIALPANEINLTLAPCGTVISGDHHVTELP